MVSKSIGIMIGIALANCIQSSTPLALATFGVVTWVHMFCNLKSYQSIQLRTLNPYRASTPFLYSYQFYDNTSYFLFRFVIFSSSSAFHDEPDAINKPIGTKEND